MQQFMIQTLIDITETGLHRGADKVKVNQQQNFNTAVNTIGLRLNCHPVKVICEKQNIAKIKKLIRARDFEKIEMGMQKRLPSHEDLHPNTRFVTNAAPEQINDLHGYRDDVSFLMGVR